MLMFSFLAKADSAYIRAFRMRGKGREVGDEGKRREVSAFEGKDQMSGSCAALLGERGGNRRTGRPRPGNERRPAAS